jgi:TolB protein
MSRSASHRTHACRALTLPVVLTVLFAACSDSNQSTPTSPATVTGAPAAALGSKSVCGPRCANPILFDRFVNGGLTHYVGKMDADGSNVTLLHPGSNPAWGPGYTRIAFNYTSGIPGQDIWTMNADGTGAMPVTTNGQNIFPAFSPDGSKIAFVSTRTGSQQIFVMNADGTNQTQLTNVAENVYPSWSPDGTKILFASNRTGNDDLFVMNADGSNVKRLTTDPGLDDAGVWSPDGKQIAYMNAKAGCDIVIMKADGSAKKPVVNGLDDCETPSWSSSGNKLAFVSQLSTGGYAIFTMNTDGSALAQITLGRYMDVLPAWSRK